MTLGANLSLRIAAILLICFVLLQAMVFGITSLSGSADVHRDYAFPTPAELAAVVEMLDTAPPARRALLVEALDASLYSVRIGSLPLPPRDPDADARAIGAAYRAALPNHAVIFVARSGPLGILGAHGDWPGQLLRPATLAVSLRDGAALVLVSRPSPVMGSFLRQRAGLGAVAGLAVLLALGWAVRQTTRPIAQLAASIRRFATRLNAPDLPIAGLHEMRDLASAYNDMKHRISELMSERTQILAGIAHDLRTYLTRLRLRAEFIGDADQRERAARDIAEMSLLLDDTLLFAQPAGTAITLQPVELADEVAQIVRLRREMGDDVAILASAPAMALADRLSLRRALANLIDNGLRHGSRVTLCLVPQNRHVCIVVADDGSGVPEEMLATLGQPFGRLDPSRDRSSGGAGLGLAIVRALADRQGGSVSFRNRPEGGLEAGFCLRNVPAE